MSIRTAATLLGALLLLATCPLRTAALYADQAGRYDWLQQHVGRVSAARLASGPRPALLVASSAAGTLAALDPTDGSLRWRKVLAEGDAITVLEVADSRAFTLSGAGRQLLAWDVKSGAALWAADVAGAHLAVMKEAVLVSFAGGVKVGSP